MLRERRLVVLSALICLLVSIIIGCGGGAGSSENDPLIGSATSATIFEPQDSSTYHIEDLIVFTGSLAGVTGSGNAQYVWRSDKDGQIGVGTSFETNRLSEGVHLITLTVSDNNGHFVFDTIRVSIVTEEAVVGTVFVGKGPAYLAITPDGEHIYVPNALEDTVSVIQTSDSTIVATVKVGDGPVAVEILSDGKFAYVSNSNDNTVSVIQTSDNTVVHTIDVGYRPWGMTATANGEYVYVVNGGYPDISVVQTGNDIEIDRIAQYPGTHQSPDTPKSDYSDIAVSSDGNFLYITATANISISPDDLYAHGDGEIIVVQTSDNTITDTISVGDLPTRIITSPDGNYVYITNAQDNSVSVIQTIDNALIDTISVGPYPDDIAITSDGDYVFVTNNGDNSVSQIRLADNVMVDTITVGALPWGIAISPVNSTIYVSNFDDNTVSIIDPSKL